MKQLTLIFTVMLVTGTSLLAQINQSTINTLNAAMDEYSENNGNYLEGRLYTVGSTLYYVEKQSRGYGMYRYTCVYVRVGDITDAYSHNNSAVNITTSGDKITFMEANCDSDISIYRLSHSNIDDYCSTKTMQTNYFNLPLFEYGTGKTNAAILKRSLR